MENTEIEKILDSLSLDEMIGQMMCIDFDSHNIDKVAELARETKAGTVFVANNTPEHIRTATEIIESNTRIPAMVSADIECGPGHILKGEVNVTNPMSWGAADDEKLVYEAHVATGERCREMGIHWSFSPIADINFNPDNPVTNVRSVSDIPRKSGSNLRGGC